jgi:hypothetical protein
MADQSDVVTIDFGIRVPRSGMEHLIDEETRVGHAALDYRLPAAVLLLVGFVLGARQLRGDYFRVVQSSDDISVAAQVSAEESRGASVSPAVMREYDERVSSSTRCRIPHSTLSLLCVSQPRREAVLNSCI